MSKTKLSLSFAIYSLLYPVHSFADNIIGTVTDPNSQYSGANGAGLFKFMSNLFKLVGTIAGIYMIIQFILAGYQYITASGDPKKAEAAWTQIWQSIVGMVIIASAFVIASVVERFTGIKIINPTIYGPN